MSRSALPRRWRRLPAATAAGVALLLLAGPATAGTAAPPDREADAPIGLERSADEQADVVEVVVDGTAALDELVATGVDLDHHVTQTAQGIVVHAVVTPTEVAALKRRGYRVGAVLHDAADSAQRVSERDATIAAHQAENRAYTATLQRSAAASDVKIIRADYYTSGTNQVLSVEAKWAQGQTSTSTLTVARDSGPGTEIGSGGTQNISRFVDAGVYLYHRGAAAVTARPQRIQITSPTGDVAVAEVKEWLPIPADSPEGPGYQKDFVTSYLTPTELYDRIKRLADAYPQLAEVVKLPYQTNGYRRKAQVVLGGTNATRVAVDSLAWGHEGGNDLTVELADPGAADRPLTVTVTGKAIRVSLATDATGVVTSTAAQVAAALTAEAGALVTAYTYRGDAGAGVVTPVAPTPLSDNLKAPAGVSRDPHPVYAIRIGKYRDGSRTGVLAYAQEHAREWVPPLVTIETAERLLRNHATDENTKQLLRTLDIWIVPSINPDGGHYSFYDYASQRRNMTNHCAPGGATDALARNSWGVDNNRNYTEYSLFDGYSGASASCTGDTYAGPSELSEPENRNVDWLAQRPNMKFSMNLHSSGNYFMWSPGAYATPGRISAPGRRWPTSRSSGARRRASSPRSSGTATWRSPRPGPARSPTCCTRRRATPATCCGTSTASTPGTSRWAPASSPPGTRRTRRPWSSATAWSSCCGWPGTSTRTRNARPAPWRSRRAPPRAPSASGSTPASRRRCSTPSTAPGRRSTPPCTPRRASGRGARR
ncbi:M14 family zinc carboxypeptidase [Micromonospora sp. RL09-050-HVF-A]|uniref:M14 family zinc carboxypeptidase n=1 Tax=Micromonospora sp. RL09-050-HVF-A TaxID=1703433 RepID=UPI001C5D4FE8|nr:M14 family zinc carboxypeptidase [Micromonospora sp. RL09-050-HVF-A]MBW4701580.1 peptidase M14 [Micromonospora sp. RL09-050-HVF-A]